MPNILSIIKRMSRHLFLANVLHGRISMRGRGTETERKAAKAGAVTVKTSRAAGMEGFVIHPYIVVNDLQVQTE